MGLGGAFVGDPKGPFPLPPLNVDSHPILDMPKLFVEGIVEKELDFGSHIGTTKMWEVEVDAQIKRSGISATVDSIFEAMNVVQGEQHVVLDRAGFRSHEAQRLRRVFHPAQNFVA